MISSFFLYLALRGLDFRQVLEAIGGMDKRYLIVMTVLTFVAFGMRTIRWHLILKKIKYVRVFELFKYLMTGFFINNVLPMRAGEFYRAYMLGTNYKFSRSSCLASIVIERAFDAAMFLAILAVAVTVVTLPKAVFAGIISAVIFLLVIILGIFFTVRFKVLYVKIILFLPLRNAFKDKLQGMLEGFVLGLESVLSLRLIVPVVLISAFVWSAELLSVFFLVKAFGLALSIKQIMFVMALLGIGVMIPLAPGYVGTYEFAGKSALELLGVDPATAMSFVLVLHAFQMVFIAMLGLPSMVSTQFKWKYLDKKQ